ncbi:hypothetical protein MY04_05860 (plasmid) [Flammeovirga sp. MY04]|uniref:PD-(D/E)XK nuclease-like domain-containing protein n=1 Tax=Flammeovirga sp. MY04 TaxID=1191459 RepID=UPI0008063CB1|nr:PD-(D/E)XK nuclease-like domain-containing protein [Flammeovirga sp. MY04]ANQ52904.1 hypothetical protein MY04_05860 [Flammeovirga sp. MY04]
MNTTLIENTLNEYKENFTQQLIQPKVRTFVMPDKDYRKHPAISNSDLSNAKKIINGQAIRKNTDAFRRGRFIHEAILEPSKWKNTKSFLPSEERTEVDELANIVLHNSTFKHLIGKGYWKFEQCVFWEDPVTGISCKAKMDMHLGVLIIGDLKTTRRESHEDFLKDALHFDYDKQAAFYSTPFYAKLFLLIGISKSRKTLGRLFFEEVSRESDWMKSGKEKVNTLLTAINKDPELLKAVYEARGC